jgi:hypothetical protein
MRQPVGCMSFFGTAHWDVVVPPISLLATSFFVGAHVPAAES